jgi:hypothetical protein
MQKGNEDVMPAGAMPPEQEAEEEEPILGKFKSADDLAAAYQELEKKMGEQGNELGSLKQMNEMLMEQRKSGSQEEPEEEEEDSFDYQAQMSELSNAVEEGDVSIGEALAKASELSAENATRKALSQYQEMTEQQQQQATQQQFLNDNPDFLDLQKTGQLEAVKKTLPGMHDDFSAYFALKAEQAAQAAQEKQETERIAQGAERTEKVLQNPGTNSKNIGRPAKKMTPAELKAKTLADLEALG